MKRFKETEIGLIPEEWKVDTIGNNFEVKQGKAVSQKNRIGNNQKPFLRTANIFWNKIDLTVLDKMHFTNEEEARFKLEKYDLLVCEGGAVGRTAIWLDNLEGIYYQNHLHRLRLKENKILPMFFMYWMMYCIQYTDYYSGVENKSTIPNLSQSRLNQLVFPIPKKNEQFNIAELLTIIKANIDKRFQIINTLQKLKKASMQKLFTEGFSDEPLKDTVIGKIPKSWEVVDLKDTGEVIYGIQAAVANNTKPIGTKILTNINIDLNGKLNLDKIRYYKLKSKRDFSSILQKGDILFNWRSGSKEHVGKTALFDLEGEWTHSSFILRIRPNKKVNNYFLYAYLNNLRINGYFVKQQTYSINAKFNKSAIEIMPVVLPKIEVQNKIAESIIAVDTKLELNIKRKNNLEQLFKNLLNQLMTGKIRVKDIEI